MLLTLAIFLFPLRKSARQPERLKRLVNLSFWMMVEILIFSWIGTILFIISLGECSLLVASLQWWGGGVVLASVGQWSLYIFSKIYDLLLKGKKEI